MTEEKKATLKNLAETFEALCDQIDTTETDLKEDIMIEFSHIQGQLANKIDRCVDFLDFCDSQEEMLKTKRERIDSQLKRAKSVKQKFRKYLIFMAEKSEVPLKGNDSEIKLRKCPEAVSFNLLLKSKNFSKILTKEEYLELPEMHDYLKKELVFVVDTDKIKTSLKAGNQLNFAKLTRKNSITIK